MANAGRPCNPWPWLSGSPVHRSALVHLFLIGILLAAATAGAMMLGLPSLFALGTGTVYAALGIYVATFVGDHAPHVRFGIANRVTLLRAVVACLLGGLVLVAPEAPTLVLWTAATGGFIALFLDGLDGLIARRRGEVSRFGASFDLETDALLILLLSILMYRLDRAGAWVIAIGLMRYAFIAAGRLWTSLAAPLPESFRRKAVCVAQVAVLVACIPPALPDPFVRLLLAGALAALAISFALDILRLIRQDTVPSRQQASSARQIMPPRL